MVFYFLQGGAFMWPILAAGVIGLVFSIERLYYLLKGNIKVETFTNDVTSTLKDSGIKAAIAHCDEAQGPVRNIFMAALERVGLGASEAEKAMEARGAIEMANLEKNMSWLTFFISTAPMLGFLGTVVGMINAFDDIKAANDISPAVVAGGISVALLTTAFGLIIAVILQLLQNIALNIIEGHVLDMETSSGALVESFTDLERDGNLKA
ncbi:MAG: MotA/TolQ/ExbB proton channel family protein [Candidatus Marinimicrobia bacterium]|nr:MotA/TolQ/ExbB proton channel family protein [Candidatus Neomarinimicrobiota bacterium]